MDYQNIRADKSESKFITLTLNRPKSLNAINIQLIRELHDFFSQTPEEFGPHRAVIITGSGEKAFAAGADITEIARLSTEEGIAFSEFGHETMHLIETFHIPVIAAVNGFALGGGCELAMACHFRIASENAKMSLPEVGLGLIPGYGGTQRLAQIVGKGKAFELILTGDMINADEALRIGLVNRVVPLDELMQTCAKIASKIANKGPVAVEHAIMSINAFYESGDAGFVSEIENFGALIESEDAKEGTSAFLEKRKADFTGK
jgi:enoyl-CoA hydratase